MTTTKAAKPITTIARAQFKNNDAYVLYRVQSGDNQYDVTVYHGVVKACTCPARKPCKHMAYVERRENERSSDLAPHDDIHGCVDRKSANRETATLGANNGFSLARR
jgi:hypothetical protein